MVERTLLSVEEGGMDYPELSYKVGTVLRNDAAKLRYLADLYRTVHGPDCLIVKTLEKSEWSLTGVADLVAATVAENQTSPDGK
jgi:hypothetical protein